MDFLILVSVIIHRIVVYTLLLLPSVGLANLLTLILSKSFYFLTNYLVSSVPINRIVQGHLLLRAHTGNVWI